LHRTAAFTKSPSDEDYHAQYVAGGRVESLRKTRARQAVLILDAIRRHVPDADDFLDFGSGRGWFLATCRRHGLERGAAADTSELAVRTAAEDGFAALQLPDDESSEGVVEALRSLPFRPRVLTMLDVVEHFTPDRVIDHLNAIVAALQPELEIVVVKVPAAEGLFHRVAGSAAAVRVTGPLEQLYQVGTYPPHYNYFTRRSLLQIAQRLGWQVLEVIGDRDFEPEALTDRVLVLNRLPSGARNLLGGSLGRVAARMPMPDAQILVARVSQLR
jgi:hypothetical protein